jgi:hypothetical protein
MKLRALAYIPLERGQIDRPLKQEVLTKKQSLTDIAVRENFPRRHYPDRVQRDSLSPAVFRRAPLFHLLSTIEQMRGDIHASAPQRPELRYVVFERRLM